MTTIKKLGRDFKLRRTDEGITQEALSKRSGVSTLTIQKIERGDGNVTIKTIEKLSNALDSLITINIKSRNDG